jgi:RNA polymerase sigma-70 factor (ECF subfamily)
MESARESDEQLMQQVSRGDRPPLSILLRRHANSLLTFLQRMCGNHHRSEELFQETFLAVWTGRERYRYPRPFRAWLFGIALNKCRAELRDRWPGLVSLDGGAGLIASSGPAPVEAAIATETAALVQKAVLRLPPRQRSVVVLRIWNNLPYAEIAAALGQREATVRTSMFHALATMRKYLEPQLR